MRLQAPLTLTALRTASLSLRSVPPRWVAEAVAVAVAAASVAGAAPDAGMEPSAMIRFLLSPVVLDDDGGDDA